MSYFDHSNSTCLSTRFCRHQYGWSYGPQPSSWQMNVGTRGQEHSKYAGPLQHFKMALRPSQPKLSIRFVDMRWIAVEEMDHGTKRTIVGRNGKKEQSRRLE